MKVENLEAENVSRFHHLDKNSLRNMLTICELSNRIFF
ncbi:hypothetical protein GILI108418_03055 [Gillisia limnaea]|uniref:Uncharacterized protein n=1 Tax=Gillisia limnaea (strain DSM 15749 / LMG 21470 / R-8282) TaxID=865937 RepID=H2BVH7_GILLR|nr:hypothetical protein Gilli_2253 [Gillisia limnaea DSM 15749]